MGWVDMVFYGSVPASTTTLEVDGGEVLEARWFPLDDLPPLTPNTDLLLGVYGIGPAAAGNGPGDDGANAAAREPSTVEPSRAAEPDGGRRRP